MAPVNNLIDKFEDIARPELSAAESVRRVRVKRYSMPLRQSTLNFGGSGPVTAPKRRSTSAVLSKESVHAPTPPAEDVPTDTIVVDTTETRIQLSRSVLPTPSESATDASSQSSNTPKMKSPTRTRSKRVSSARKSASKETLARTMEASNEKQRNISGKTLVASATTSQTSLLKTSVDALDMTWNIDIASTKQDKLRRGDEDIEDSTITVNAEVNAVSTEKQRLPGTNRADRAQTDDRWEQRRRAAEQNATRKSSRASLLTKATELVSGITSSVLGKRKNKEKDQIIEKPASTISEEPMSKKVRLDVPAAAADNGSLTTTNRSMRSRAPKDKKWLTSGLYAGQTRSIDPTKTEAKNKRKSGADTTDTSSTAAEKENYVLPLPMFAGARVLETGRDFKLPFDVFSPLPSGQPKPDEWRKVNKNVFVGDAAAEWRTNKFSEHSTCMCKAATGCDADCMNKYMYYECDEWNCNLTSEQCGNRAFEGLRQRVKKGGRYNVGVEVLQTADRGYGVRANRTFEPGQIIVEYTGEIITQEECENRMHGQYKNNDCYYLMAFDQNMIIDATRGSIARFVNHSCDPSCRMEKWTVSGKPRMALFAGDRHIMTGEELTYDYNFDPYSQKNVQVCRCGSENCRGVLGPKPKDLPKDKESKLAGAKRKIAEVLEESKEIITKKRKVDEKPKLPKGWAYIEPEPKKLKKPKVTTDADDDGEVKEQPSKLKRMLSQKSSKSVKSVKGAKVVSRKGDQRIVSTSSAAALITRSEEEKEHEEERPKSAVESLKAKAEGLKRTVSRSLRGAR